jgi:hypothetical protein
MQDLSYSDITYCPYGYPYKKTTCIRNTLEEKWNPRPICCKLSACPAFALEGVLPFSEQRGAFKVKGQRRGGDNCIQAHLYSMPPELCEEIAQSAETCAEEELLRQE